MSLSTRLASLLSGYITSQCSQTARLRHELHTCSIHMCTYCKPSICTHVTSILRVSPTGRAQPEVSYAQAAGGDRQLGLQEQSQHLLAQDVEGRSLRHRAVHVRCRSDGAVPLPHVHRRRQQWQVSVCVHVCDVIANASSCVCIYNVHLLQF